MKHESIDFMGDSHCHFDELFYLNPDLISQQNIILPSTHGYNGYAFYEALKLPELYYTLGFHPWFIHDCKGLTQKLDRLHLLLSSSHCIGVGEIGLDKYAYASTSVQETFFMAQAELACSLRQKMIIHSVRRHDRIAQLIKTLPIVAGIIHGFSGSIAQAKKFIDLGFKIGIGALLLNKNFYQFKRFLQTLPLESFLLESDAPLYFCSNSYFSNLKLILNRFSFCLNIDASVLAQQLNHNLERFIADHV